MWVHAIQQVWYHLSPCQVRSCYEWDGFDFLLKVFNSLNYLEDLTGLSQLYAETQDDQVCLYTQH